MASLIPQQRRPMRLAWWAVLPWLAVACVGSMAGAQELTGQLEVGLKAAFLYKFSGYVEWPDLPPESPLTFGVLGDEGVADALSRIVRERGAGARPVSVVRVRPFEPMPPVHVLFVGRSESDRLAAVLRSVRRPQTLLVTDTEGALALGSMINFVVVDQHMRFEVGLGAAKRSGLTLSSRLLAVAQTVSRRTP